MNTRADNTTPVRGPRRLAGPYAALHGNANMTLLFSGQVVSALGDWLYLTALIVLVYDLTHSATLAAALTAVRLLPYILGSPLGGLLADRVDRRRLMIAADLGRALCMLGLLAAGTAHSVWLAFPLVFVTTALGSLFRPALQATVPAVAGSERALVQANALMSQIDALAIVLGPALGGVLALLGAPRLAFALNALSYAASALTLARLRLTPGAAAPQDQDEHPAQGGTRVWLAETAAGFRVLFGTPGGLLGTVTLGQAVLSAFSGASWTLLVVLAEQVWRLGGSGVGILFASYGLGGVAGGFVAGAVSRRLGPAGGVIASLAVAAAAVLFLGVSPLGAIAGGLLALFGMADIVNQVVGTTLIQEATPPALLGRAFGAFEATAVSAAVLGALGVGPLIAVVGPQVATVLLAAPSLALVSATVLRLRIAAVAPAPAVGAPAPAPAD